MVDDFVRDVIIAPEIRHFNEIGKKFASRILLKEKTSFFIVAKILLFEFSTLTALDRRLTFVSYIFVVVRCFISQLLDEHVF